MNMEGPRNGVDGGDAYTSEIAKAVALIASVRWFAWGTASLRGTAGRTKNDTPQHNISVMSRGVEVRVT